MLSSFLQAKEPEPKVFSTWVLAQIAIEADGKVSSVRYPDQKLGTRLTSIIDAKLLEPGLFTPGQREGKPARTEIGVSIQLRAETLATGQTEMSIANMMLAPTIAKVPSTAPIYPEGKARAGTAGFVLLKLSYNTEGKVETTSVVKSEGGKSFADSAQRWVKGMRLRPETVGGVGVAGEVQLPFVFVMAGEAHYKLKLPGGQTLIMRPGEIEPR